MIIATQGIPNLPDLTHPQELIDFGTQLLQTFLTLALLIGGLGVVIALISFAMHRHEAQPTLFIREWVLRYSQLLRGSYHAILLISLLIFGFFLCSTLSNRYHHWEQAKVAQVAASVAGYRLEQRAPHIRYLVEEPYVYNTWIDGELVRVEDVRQVARYLALDSSDIQVKIEQIRNLQDRSPNYNVDFVAEYSFTNPLGEAQELWFEIAEPYNYSLLQNFSVQRQGERLQPINPGDYSFPLQLEPGQATRFSVTYQAQGGQRWVYLSDRQLLSNFRLGVSANFPKVDFASGIAPTESKKEGGITTYTWIFKDNVSVRNPFGIFTATDTLKNTGVIPRLLLLAPGLFLWWILLLYLSVPLTLRNSAIAGGLFFACLLALTYFSRIIYAQLAWVIISLILLWMVWGLGNSVRASLAAIICTIAGAILPVLGLLVSYSGLTLSLAALLSVIWLAARNWYGWMVVDS